MFHRCVIAVMGVLAIGTAAAAGPIKLDAKAPSFELAELRAMDQKELRALFFRGGGARNAAASCADCVAANSRLRALDRDGKSAEYTAAFPFTAARLYSRSPRPTGRRNVRPHAFRISLAGPALATDVLGAVPLPSSEGTSPVAVVSPSAMPEPNTLALIATGAAGAWLLRRRRQSFRQVSRNGFTLVDRALPKRNRTGRIDEAPGSPRGPRRFLLSEVRIVGHLHHHRLDLRHNFPVSL